MPQPSFDLSSLRDSTLQGLLNAFRSNAAIPDGQGVGQIMAQRANPTAMFNMLLRGPDPTIGGELGMAGELSRIGQAGIKTGEEGLQNGREIFLKAVVGGPAKEAGSNSLVHLSSPSQLTAGEFKSAFLSDLPKNTNVDVQRLRNDMHEAVDPGHHSFRMDWFDDAGRSIKPPKDFYQRFGVEGETPHIAPSNRPAVKPWELE